MAKQTRLLKASLCCLYYSYLFIFVFLTFIELSYLSHFRHAFFIVIQSYIIHSQLYIQLNTCVIKKLSTTLQTRRPQGYRGMCEPWYAPASTRFASLWPFSVPIFHQKGLDDMCARCAGTTPRFDWSKFQRPVPIPSTSIVLATRNSQQHPYDVDDPDLLQGLVFVMF